MRFQNDSFIFPLFCFREGKDDIDESENVLDFLSIESIRGIGGRVLALFPVADLKSIRDPGHFREVMSEIGKIPMHEIINLIAKDKFEALANRLSKEFGHDFSLNNLVSAGSLIYGMKDIAFDPADFRTYVTEHMKESAMKTICVTKGMVMSSWRTAIVEAFS